MKVEKWNEIDLGKLTLENLHRLYSSEKGYIVRWNKYNDRAEFSGWSKKVIKFILTGNCEIQVNEEVFFLRSNDYLEIPEGKYHFKVIGDEVVEYVMVFKLPETD